MAADMILQDNNKVCLFFINYHFQELFLGNLRRKYAIIGCTCMMFFGSHGVLLWRRRSENRALNKEIPPIPYVEFERDYLLTGKVKSIVVHPHFQVCDAYTERKDLTPEKVSKSMLQSVSFYLFSNKLF